MKNYQAYLQYILNTGAQKTDRTSTGTISRFGLSLRWDLEEGFPAVTTKKLAWKSVVGELLWFLRGSTNIHTLREITHGYGSKKSTIWDGNYKKQGRALGYKNGELGPVYGSQWRNWGGKGIDQLQNAIDTIKDNPNDRRIIVSAWNVEDIPKMALPPCHKDFQFYVDGDELSLMWNQRSVDSFLGLPFNIASYALLLEIIAMITGKKAKELIFIGGDCHIYNDHLEQVDELLRREPHDLPNLAIRKKINNLDDLETMTVDDFILEDYEHHEAIKADMAV